MTDEVTVADLEDGATVYKSSTCRGHSSRKKVHTDRECSRLETADTVHAKPAATMHPDRGVCRECTGAYDRATAGGGPSPAIMLMRDPDVGPADVGLSPIGERPTGGSGREP